jgi:competence protein ComEC
MLLHGFQAALFAQRHRFALWLPVWLGIGIAIYFAIRFEPDINHIFAVTFFVCILAAFAFALPGSMRVLMWVPIFVCLGFLLAVMRAHTVNAPKLSWHYYGSVEGTVAHLDRSSSDKPALR